MSTTKDVLRIALAFVGVLVGAGFASGQEIMQFFASFGGMGFAGAIISSVLFIFLAMALATLGQNLGAKSHKEVIVAICGRYLGALMDWLITFFMFAVGVVMLAGGGALVEQLTGIPKVYGAIATTILTIAIVCLDVRKVVMLIGAVTPLLVLMTIIVAAVTISQSTLDFATLSQAAEAQPHGASHWLLAAVLYVSYNIVAGTPFLVIMGGGTTQRRTAMWGGITGGVLLSFLILLIAGGMFAQVNDLNGVPMPMLLLATKISPVLGAIMGLTIFGMILNTSVGVFYSFSARILTPGTARFRWGTVIAGVVGLFASFVGFIKLVGTVYPFFGYLGFVLMICTAIGWWRYRSAVGAVEAA